jgi:hypothetical protein
VKRRLFAILSALSLLLFVAVCVMWVRSYWVGDRVSWTTREQMSDSVEVRFRYAGWENGQRTSP